MNIRKIRKLANKYTKLLNRMENEKYNELNSQIEKVMKEYSREINGTYEQRIEYGVMVHEVQHKPIKEGCKSGLILEVSINNSDTKNIMFLAMDMEDIQKGEKPFTQVVYRDSKEPVKYTINALNKYIKKVKSYQGNRIIQKE